VNLVCDPKGRTETEDVREQGVRKIFEREIDRILE
jgi:hypothetical protein